MRQDIFVVDTCALISYFSNIFEANISISQSSIELIDLAFHTNEIKLIFPSAVFIELFIKWFKDEEIGARIKTEIYYRIKNRENMQIRTFDRETLENYMRIQNIEDDKNFDGHDKQIFASAMTMECQLITSDERLIRYNKKQNLIPGILN
jgi:predicted nucleic acid-binding protein